MIIGRFYYSEDNDTYWGHIVTLSIELYGVRLVPDYRQEANDPAYRVMLRVGQLDINLGTAWKRTNEHGPDFLSVAMDCPGLSEPLNAELRADFGSFAMEWTRPQPTKADVA